jgi:hypothetical protein
MSKHFLWSLMLAFLLVSCTTGNSLSQEEIIQKTIVSIVNQELASTPSKVPSTATPIQIATETPTMLPTSTITPTLTLTLSPSLLANYPIEGYGPDNFPVNINPLTGLSVSNLSKLDRRPISVKVSNYPRGIRPQWGLSLADHVFEYYHEAGLTRFNAIYYSNDVEQIGPIRSGRFSDKDIIEMYKAFFVFGSADWRVRERLYSADFSNRLASISDYPCPPTAVYPLCRIDQDTWNHLVTKTDVLYQHFEREGVSNERQDLNGLVFNLDLPPEGQPASNIMVRYSQGSYHEWIYDPITGKYFRQQDIATADQGQEVFEPMKDRLTGALISADNVIVLLANHNHYSVKPEMIQIPFDGVGKAYVFREGHVYLVNWSRLADQDLISLSYDEGGFFPLKPGNIWFVVMGETSQVTEEGPDWKFKFNFP